MLKAAHKNVCLVILQRIMLPSLGGAAAGERYLKRFQFDLMYSF